jgi:HAMP domain-containing protein
MTGQMPPHYSTNAEVNRQNARQEVESNRGSVNVLRQYGQRRDGHANTRWIGRNGSDRTRR